MHVYRQQILNRILIPVFSITSCDKSSKEKDCNKTSGRILVRIGSNVVVDLNVNVSHAAFSAVCMKSL